MSRHPSADPGKLILGRGTKSERVASLEGIEARDKQIWIVEDSSGDVVGVEQYDDEEGEWINILSGFVQSVSGIDPNVDGEVSQVIEVDGPSPEIEGKDKQIGIDQVRGEVFWYVGGRWVLISSSDSVEGATQTHSLDPSADQVNDPASAPSTAIGDGTGDLSSGDYKWAITYICPWGETLIGDSATDPLTVSSGDDVDLSDIPTASEDVVDGRKIYRTAADGSTFYYVDTISDNSTTTYTDTTADGDLGSEPPTSNTTEAHDGNLPEGSVAFDYESGHNHDGANSRMVVTPEHDIAGSKHTGGLPWSELEEVPDSFSPSDHDLDPSGGPHLGTLPWGEVSDKPDLASDPHGDEAHTESYSKDGHGNESHDENYITSATERIRYGAGQLGGMTSQSNLQPPVPIDTACTAVKSYVLSRMAPSSDVSGTILVEDSSREVVFKKNMVLPNDNTIAIDYDISESIPSDSMIRFSLNDSDADGRDFAIYLIVEVSIGS